MDLTPGSGRSPEEGHGNPLQYSCLENPPGQPAGLQSMGHKELDMTEQLSTATPVYQAEEVLATLLSQVEHKQTIPQAQDS